jgi:hypothetical protein
VSGYSRQPILLDACTAHERGFVTYDWDTQVTLRSPEILERTGHDRVLVPPSRQYPLVRATFDDLGKAISSLANSPELEDGRTLRQAYEAELAHYEALVERALARDECEPGYGSYVYDPAKGDLYLIAPERWHRLALVTSNSKLSTDPAGMLSWSAIRRKLEGAVVGFAGLSVGSNLLEGWLREARPARVKLADPDWVELTNLNRGERMSLRHVVQSRAARFAPRNPYDNPRVGKAEFAAYEAQLVDPYLKVDVYEAGLDRENLRRFLLGDGNDEPPIDILVEEMDHLELKVLVREEARRHRIDVLMLSDFGHQAHVLWNPFRSEPDGPLGYGASDERLEAALADVRSGERSKVFSFAAALCGADFAEDEFAQWVRGEGEQPTSSLPQSGATAMASGAIGGKELALHVLGHPAPDRGRVVYDFRHRCVKGQV